MRRILVGEAGERIQGFLAKLGIDKSYVMVNTFLYKVYGFVKAKYRTDPGILEYRHRWLDAPVIGQRLEAVVALGAKPAKEEGKRGRAAKPRGRGEG